MNKSFMKKTGILVLLMSLAGCCISTFTPIDSDFRPKGKTLAVVAALDNEENITIAYYMTEALRKNSRFHLVPQKQVAQTLGYPIKIHGPFKSAFFEIETDYSKTDVKKIRAIQQKLAVDYLYVIWTPSATVFGSSDPGDAKIHQVHAVGQMFEGANSREVGNGRFDITAGHTTCCLASAPKDEDKTNAMKDTAEYVANEIAEKTGMQKR